MWGETLLSSVSFVSKSSVSCVVCYNCHWQKQEETELGKTEVPASQTGKRECMIPSLLAGELCFKYLPQQLVGAVGTPFALLKWKKIHMDSNCILFLEVQGE